MGFRDNLTYIRDILRIINIEPIIASRSEIMKTRLKWVSIALGFVFIATTFSGALGPLTPYGEETQGVLAPGPVGDTPLGDETSSFLFGAVFLRLVINPSFSDIKGIGLPTTEGKHPARFIANLQWSATGPGSTILYVNLLNPKFETIPGSTSGKILLYMGSVEITNRLVGATEYSFRGLAWSVNIQK